jgi:outer membrane immunogenic protein
VTGGLAYGEVHSHAYDYEDLIYDHTKMRTGWTAGAGVEYAITPKWSVKAEGLYYDLGRDTGYVGEVYGPYTDEATGVVARVGINYRLGGCCDAMPLK